MYILVGKKTRSGQMFFSVHRGVFACASVFEFVCRQYPLWIYWSLRCVVVRYEKPHWSNVPMGLSWFCPFVFSAFWAKNGARTRDPDLGKVVLYQLSYFRGVKLIWAENGIRTRDPHLGKVVLYHWAISAIFLAKVPCCPLVRTQQRGANVYISR